MRVLFPFQDGEIPDFVGDQRMLVYPSMGVAVLLSCLQVTDLPHTHM